MPRRFTALTYLLVGLLMLSGPLAHSAAAASIASQADLDGAVAKSLSNDQAARETIQRLLQRDDVRAMAKGYGLDVHRAQKAVGTLQGVELQKVSTLAASAETQLAGGDEYIRISLVALLLVIIIIILLTR
jgi:hypothetical protein